MSSHRPCEDSYQLPTIPSQETNGTSDGWLSESHQALFSTDASVLHANPTSSSTLSWPTTNSSSTPTMNDEIFNSEGTNISLDFSQPSNVQFGRRARDDTLPYSWTGSNMIGESGMRYGTAGLQTQAIQGQWIDSSSQSLHNMIGWDCGHKYFHPVVSVSEQSLQERDAMFRRPTASNSEAQRETPASTIPLDSTLASPFLEQSTCRMKIGSMYATDSPDVFVFQCDAPRCGEKTYGRWYDFKRHYDGAHAEQRTEFWCCVLGCERSEGLGGRPFPRKDKLNDHVRKIHCAQT